MADFGTEMVKQRLEQELTHRIERITEKTRRHREHTEPTTDMNRSCCHWFWRTTSVARRLRRTGKTEGWRRGGDDDVVKTARNDSMRWR